MKKPLFLLSILLSSYLSFSQTDKTIDSTAVFVLDKMSDIIGDLTSVTFDINTSVDKVSASNNLIKSYSKTTVTFSGPDKLLVRTDGSRGQSGFWYDGEYFTYYNYDENNYVTLEAPDTTLEMIDQMHLDFDFTFPAADFFYPNFTDDVLEHFNTIKFLGKKTVDNEECYHILASNDNIDVQIWVANKTYLLPKHFVITYKKESNRQYESTFSNWSLNPDVPDRVFHFLTPPTAKLINILKKS